MSSHSRQLTLAFQKPKIFKIVMKANVECVSQKNKTSTSVIISSDKCKKVTKHFVKENFPFFTKKKLFTISEIYTPKEISLKSQ